MQHTVCLFMKTSCKVGSESLSLTYLCVRVILDFITDGTQNHTNCNPSQCGLLDRDVSWWGSHRPFHYSGIKACVVWEYCAINLTSKKSSLQSQYVVQERSTSQGPDLGKRSYREISKMSWRTIGLTGQTTKFIEERKILAFFSLSGIKPARSLWNMRRSVLAEVMN